MWVQLLEGAWPGPVVGALGQPPGHRRARCLWCCRSDLLYGGWARAFPGGSILPPRGLCKGLRGFRRRSAPTWGADVPAPPSLKRD